jgi:hypothetical protein
MSDSKSEAINGGQNRILTRTAQGALAGTIIGAVTGNVGRGALLGTGFGAAAGVIGLGGGKRRRSRSRRISGGKICPTGTYRISKVVKGHRRKVCSRTAYSKRNGTISGGSKLSGGRSCRRK